MNPTRLARMAGMAALPLLMGACSVYDQSYAAAPPVYSAPPPVVYSAPAPAYTYYPGYYYYPRYAAGPSYSFGFSYSSRSGGHRGGRGHGHHH